MSSFNPYDHIGFLTKRVARLMTISLEDTIDSQALHFPGSCIGVMADLWAKDGVNQKNLGMSLIKTKSSINKMLTSLEKDGLIIKKDDPLDGRGKNIFLTEKGRALQTSIEQKSRLMEENSIQNCTKEEIQIAKKVLAELYNSLQAKIKEKNQ